MTATYTQPFTCIRCSTMPKGAFAINPVTDDWMIFYPEKHLIHIHFGPSTHESRTNDATGIFIHEWWDKVTAQDVTKKLYFINDLTRKDDSEVIEGKMRETLKYIRAHKQDGGGATYGQTWSMGFLLSVVAKFTRRPVNLKNSMAECEADYEKWFADPKNRYVGDMKE